MKIIVLLLTLLAAMPATFAMEKDEVPSLVSMPPEMLTEIACKAASLEFASEVACLEVVSEEKPSPHWIKFFKRIQQLRTVCKYFRNRLLRTPGDVDTVLATFLPSQSSLRSCLAPFFAKFAPETDLEKQLVTIASDPEESLEAFNLFKKAFEQKEWNAAFFALRKMPQQSVMAIISLLENTMFGESTPSKKLLEIVNEREPNNKGVLAMLRVMDISSTIETPDEFVANFLKFWTEKNKDTAQTVQHFLEHYPFAESDRVVLEKLCSKSKENADEISRNFAPMGHSRATRYLAFLSAVASGSVDLTQALLKIVPQVVISVGLPVSIAESDSTVFRLIYNAFRLPDENDIVQFNTMLLSVAFQHNKMDIIGCLLENFNLDEDMQQRCVSFYKACSLENSDEMQACLDAGIPREFIEWAAILMVARSCKKKCINLLLKKIHEFGSLRDVMETQLLPTALSLSNNEMKEFLETLLTKLKGDQWWVYPDEDEPA